MKIFILTVLSLLLISLAVILVSKIRVVIKYSKISGEEFKLNIKLSCLGGIIKKEVFSKHSDKKKKSFKQSNNDEITESQKPLSQKIHDYLNGFKEAKEICSPYFLNMRKSVFIEKLEYKMRFGVGDAAQTGILTGALWTFLYDTASLLAAFVRITEPEFAIDPGYNETVFECRGECILSMRVANLICILVSIGIAYLKYKKIKEKAAKNYVNTN